MSEKKCPIVLLGNEAHELSKFIINKEMIIKLPHPAARDNQFEGCCMFSKINNRLKNDFFKSRNGDINMSFPKFKFTVSAVKPKLTAYSSWRCNCTCKIFK